MTPLVPLVLALGLAPSSAQQEAPADVVVVVAAGVVVVPSLAEPGSIEGRWLFHAGDDPSFASPALDDRGWRAVQVPGNLGEQQVNVDAAGHFWLRVHVRTPVAGPGDHPSVRLGDIDSAYELYADGVKLGGIGDVVAHRAEHDRSGLYALPNGCLDDGEVLLAVRGWWDPLRQDAMPHRGGLNYGPLLLGPGEPMLRAQLIGDIDELVLAGIFVVVGLYHLHLFRKRREQREYRTFGVLALSIAAFVVANTKLWLEHAPFDCPGRAKWYFATAHLTFVIVIEFLWPFLGHKLGKLARSYQAVVVVYVVVVSAWPTSWLLYKTVTLFEALLLPPAMFAAVVFLCRRVHAKDPDARTIFLGGMALVATAMNDIIRQIFTLQTPELTNWAMGVLVVSMALSLANRFARVYGSLDERNASLLRVNAATRRFVPVEFLSLLQRDGIADVQRGDHVKQEMSVLFTDIRSFTTIVEQRTPEENFRWLNAYLAHVEPAITGNGGFVDSFIGDAIMALFAGANTDDAVAAGVALQRLLEEHNQQRALTGEPALSIGVGVATGSLMLGTLGGASQMKCGVIGDCVNLASRVEGMTKRYGARFLITDETRARLQRPAAFTFREVDRVRVKGKSTAVTVFEVLEADEEQQRQRKLTSLGRYQAALALYHQCAFAEAASRFAELAAGDVDDGVFALYLERARAYSVEAPEAGWDGVETLTSK